MIYIRIFARKISLGIGDKEHIIRCFSKSGKVQIWLEGDGSQNHVCANQTYPRRYLLREAVAGFEEKFA